MTTEAIIWSGNLNDDSTAHWAGLTLRTEQMDRMHWWWAVYADERQDPIADSHAAPVKATSGKKARAAAEEAARQWLTRMQSS